MTSKYDTLLSLLKEMGSAVVAFSGGVDSTFLLKAVKEAGIPALAVTAQSEAIALRELEAAKSLAAIIGVEHRIIKTREIENPDFRKNPKNRCFYCKDHLFTMLTEITTHEGYAHVLDGSNADDKSDWRPGMQAASKHGVRSPLMEAGLSKQEIRELSLSLELPTWAKPSAPCLSSRFPYGLEITEKGLRQVERAEAFLTDLGFRELRVRNLSDTARIEVSAEEIERLLDKKIRDAVVAKLKELGFTFITVDLEGFKSGKLNQ